MVFHSICFKPRQTHCKQKPRVFDSAAPVGGRHSVIFSVKLTAVPLHSVSCLLLSALHSQLNWAILLCDIIPDGINWVNCAVLTGNSAGLRTVLSSRLSHRELSSSLRECHSFLSLPADTTMASSQGTSVSSNSFSSWASHDIFLFKYPFLLHILRFLSSFRITLWPMWLANSKRQPCFYPP
jgi:hypothetical protein